MTTQPAANTATPTAIEAYLDNNATTRCDPLVIEAMLPYLREHYANASSTHRAGAAAAAAVEQARSQVARMLTARESEILFTSGGTESNNTAIRGALAAFPDRRHIVISAVEHSAIDELAAHLSRESIEVTRVPVDRSGVLSIETFEQALRPDTAIASIMLANNETGVIFPLADLARRARARGVLLHTDAVQAPGRLPLKVTELGVDLLSLSAHKLHGPKGVGVLYVRRGVALPPWQIGGPQERQRRGGTLNVPGIVGMGSACELATLRLATDAPRIAALRDQLEAELESRFDRLEFVGRGSPRLGNTSCVCFADAEAEALLLLLSEAGVYVSSGAACSSGSLEPSRVMRAMGIPPEVAQGQVRFSLSRDTTERDIQRACDALARALPKVRALNR